MKKYKKVNIIISLLLCILLISVVLVYASEEEEEYIGEYAPPILDETIIPGFFLDSSFTYKTSIPIEEDNKEINYDFFHEIWFSMPIKEYKKIVKKVWADELKWEQVDVTSIDAMRYLFKNREEAQLAVKTIITGSAGKLKEGSYSGEKIGEKCWAAKDKPIWNVPFFKTVVFLKENKVVKVSVTNFAKKVDFLFIEKIAKAICSKI